MPALRFRLAVQRMNALYKAVLFLILVWGSATTNAQPAQCVAMSHGQNVAARLNNFWATNIPLCQIPTGMNNAYADKIRGIVWADQAWMYRMRQLHGQWAAVGILAHEWGHMVQGGVTGTAAELQADCLAGVFFKGMGLPWAAAEQLARANLFTGDAEWSLDGHGTGGATRERRPTRLRWLYRSATSPSVSALPSFGFLVSSRI